jgi:hypothetical protein
MIFVPDGAYPHLSESTSDISRGLHSLIKEAGRFNPQRLSKATYLAVVVQDSPHNHQRIGGRCIFRCVRQWQGVLTALPSKAKNRQLLLYAEIFASSTPVAVPLVANVNPLGGR